MAAIWELDASHRHVVWELSGYAPSLEQRAAHLDAHRIKMVAGGERGGKSRWTAEEILCWCPQLQHGLIWIVGPDYDQARQEFRYIVDGLAAMGQLVTSSVSTPKVGSWRCHTVRGTEISTRSARNPETLAGRAPDGVAMVEAAQASYEAFLRCRGRVGEKRAPLILSGTFEGSLSWYADLWEQWQGDNLFQARSFSLPTWANLAIYPGGRHDPEIKALEAAVPADVFLERYGAVPCPPATRVFKEFQATRHVSAEAEFDPARPVQLWIDPGYAHPYAILAVQRVPGTDSDNIDHFDELWATGKTARELIAEAKGRPWWPSVKAVVMDVAGKQHPGAESQAEIWESETGLPIVMNPVPVVDGILRHRTYLMDDPLLQRPKLRHHPRCTGTLWEYGKYLYAEDKEHRPATELPIDRDNDALKAIAYGLVANFGFVARASQPSRQALQVQFRRR